MAQNGEDNSPVCSMSENVLFIYFVLKLKLFALEIWQRERLAHNHHFAPLSLRAKLLVSAKVSNCFHCTFFRLKCVLVYSTPDLTHSAQAFICY